MREISYVMVKPEFANYQAVIDEVKQRLNEAGLIVTNEGFVNYTADDAKKHYAEHVGKDFYPGLEKYITSDKAYGMQVEGENAITTIRTIIGSTKNPAEGTIRYDIPMSLGLELRITQNVVHASDSPESAKRELAIFEDLMERNVRPNY